MRPAETAPAPSPASPSTIAPLTDPEFALFRRFVYQATGIHLTDAKKQIFAVRLARRLRQLNLSSYGEYFRLIHERTPGEMGHFLECVCVHETRFFRDQEQFRHLEAEILPRWVEEAKSGRRSYRVRAWSAACSTGEEPYSLAMVLADALPSPPWNVDILASDISHQTLEIARKGIWPIDAADPIPPRYLKKYMLKGTNSQQGYCKASAELRSMMRFEPINLNDFAYPVQGEFDLIFCRHVTLYFDAETTRRVVGQLCRHLAPKGFLFMGETEVLTEGFRHLRSPHPAVYTRAEAA